MARARSSAPKAQAAATPTSPAEAPPARSRKRKPTRRRKGRKPAKPTAPGDKHPGGRPSKFTKAARAKILKAVRDGAPLVYASATARVAYRTLRSWLAQGEDDELHDRETEFLQFLHDMRHAESSPVMDSLQTIHTEAKTNWNAAIGFLRMRFPQHFGRQVVDHREMSDAEARRVLADAMGVNEDSLADPGAP